MIILLDAVYNLGKFNIEKEGLDEIDVLLDNKNIGAVILVDISEDSEGNFKYNKIFQEDYESRNKIKYLYKRGSSRGTDITPSCLITDLDKTFNNKFLKWFEKYKKRNVLFENLNDVILDNEDEIFQEISNILDNIDVKDANILLSLVISKDNQIYYLNDLNEFKNILINNSLEKYYKLGSKKIKGESICYLCHDSKEVYGLVSSAIGFAFSTPEKVGNVPGNRIENQWKLLPICGDCALYLNAGKKYVEEYLNFSECGLSYFVIPSFLFDSENNFDNLDKILKRFKHKKQLQSSELIKIENKLSGLVKNIDDSIEFKFLFYQTSNNAFDILAYVESIIPSWLNELYNSQLKIADYNFFHKENLKLIFKNDKLNFDFINLINKNEMYFPCSKDNWYKRFLRDFINYFSRKIYIDTVVDILNNKKLDYNFFLSQIMSKIRSDWRNEENFSIKITVLKSLMLIILLTDLDLIKGGKFMNSMYGEFNINLLLNSPSKKATFLLGVLTKKLMNIQYRELRSTPFYNKLWGLSLDEKKIQKLYPMVIDKLYQYDANYYSKLEKEITKNLAEANDNWNLNRDETSYFFVLGFTLPDYDKME